MPLFGPPNIVKLERNRNINGLAKALSYKDPEVRSMAAYWTPQATHNQGA